MNTSRINRIAAVAGAACLAALALGTPADATTAAHFQSPSGNINCQIVAGVADCEVLAGSWTDSIPAPAQCHNDWFPNELTLDHGQVSVGSCRGDIGPGCAYSDDGCTTLEYGRSILIGRTRCSSETDGVTCRDDYGNGRGFRIARSDYTVY